MILRELEILEVTRSKRSKSERKEDMKHNPFFFKTKWSFKRKEMNQANDRERQWDKL